jgi:hypothetical protein
MVVASAKPHRLSTVLVGRPEGQLGNRIFQAAAFLAASMEMGFPLWNPALGSYARFFPALDHDFFCRPVGGSLPIRPGRLLFCKVVDALTGRFGRPVCSMVGVSVLDVAQTHDVGELEYDLCDRNFESLLLRSRLVVAKGWKFRAHEALRTRRGRIVELFTPEVAIQCRVAENIAQARAGVDLLVGLHVRRGDYANWLGGKFYYGFETYADWIKQAEALWPEKKVGFLICSNENVDDLLSLPSVHASSGPGEPVTDLYALAACDFLIGPPSTFTLWASYYGGAPLHMLLKGSQQLHMAGFAHHQRF